MSKKKDASKNIDVKDGNKKDVTSINLSNIMDKFEKVKKNVTEKRSFVRSGLYKYTEDEQKKIQLDDRNGKAIRNGIRRKFDTLSFNVAVAIKKGEDVKTALKAFKNYYFERCAINDYSVASVTNKRNEGKNVLFFANIEICLQLLKENPNL